MASAPPLSSSPWHRGELAIQAHAGVEQRMDEIGRRAIRDHMPDQHRAFFEQLPFLVAGTVDEAGDPWATLIVGRPVFARSPDPRTLSIDTVRDARDPADAGIADGRAIGLLGIELHTRRRNRMNGTVRLREGGFDISVDQSFGNCPQYIQLRDYAFHSHPAPLETEVDHMAAPDEHALRAITSADTFFVATYSDDGGQRRVDVSHRGGKPGFVGAEEGSFLIPDFAGNLFFNTLGNILLNGKAGLLFPDFATGDLLQLSGDAELLLDGPQIAAFRGAERFWRFRPRRVTRRRNALPLRWQLLPEGWSPNTLLTGDWTEAAARLRAAERGDAWRPFRVERVADESSTIRSIYLAPADDAGLLPSKAGQHLPIRLTLLGQERAVVRTYTLTSAPSDNFYRISVKRDGAASSYLHDHIGPGDLIDARAPAGTFTIDTATDRPAVLLAAGVGITPMLAMLRHVHFEGARTRKARPVRLIYAARSKAERAFDAELADLVGAAGGAIQTIRVLSDPAGAELEDYEHLGRLDTSLLAKLLPTSAVDVHLCGPPPFMQSMYEALRSIGVADDHIHSEAFGPASLRHSVGADIPFAGGATPAMGPVRVAFDRSGREAIWVPEAGSLLELAEANGIAPDHNCRAGTCGACRTRIVAGKLAYRFPPTAAVGQDEALICVAVPADPEGSGEGVRLAL